MTSVPKPSAKNAAQLEEQIRKGQEVYHRLEMNQTPEPARSALRELLFAVEKARDQSPSDETGWVKLLDVPPFVNAAYARMNYPLCTPATLKIMLRKCIGKGVVDLKRCMKNGKIEEYVQPTGDFAAFKFYVNATMPRVPPAGNFNGPIPGTSFPSKWWEQDDEKARASGFTKMCEQLAPVVESFWKGKKVMERIDSTSGLSANKDSILDFVHALCRLENKTPDSSGIHLYRITAHVANEAAMYGGAPLEGSLETIVSDAIRTGLITPTSPFNFKSTEDSADLILYVLGEKSFEALVIGAQVDKRFDAFFTKFGAELFPGYM